MELEFRAPCCTSIRECNVRKHLVISISRQKVLREINAVRCGRGEERRYKFYPSNDVVLVSYYVSNRGNLHLDILWKPDSIDRETAIRIAKKATGWLEEEVIDAVRSCVKEIEDVFR